MKIRLHSFVMQMMILLMGLSYVTHANPVAYPKGRTLTSATNPEGVSLRSIVIENARMAIVQLDMKYSGRLECSSYDYALKRIPAMTGTRPIEVGYDGIVFLIYPPDTSKCSTLAIRKPISRRCTCFFPVARFCFPGQGIQKQDSISRPNK